jgi:hypothetical protein
MRLLTATIVLPLALLTSCASFSKVYVADSDVGGAILASSTDADGTERRWKAYPGRGSDPRIERTVVRVDTVAKIGVTARTIDRETAETRGLEPWQGVMLTQVVSGMPADRAGLVKGDVVLAVDGEPIASAEQFTDVLRSRAVPDQPLALTVRVGRRPGEGFDATSTATVTVTPVGERVRDTKTESIAIQASRGVQAFSGMQAAELEPSLVTEIYGGGSQVLITGVVAGSPAYLAGFRSGDRVLTVDGAPATSLDALRDAVLRRVHAHDPRTAGYDLASRRSSVPATAATSEPVVLEVDGLLGPHRAEVEIRDDIGERTSFYVPILTGYESTVDRTEWDFLDFILQFGFSYEGNYMSSPTRAPRRNSRFSLFPFGMFKVEHWPAWSRYTFLWFIDFEVDR